MPELSYEVRMRGSDLKDYRGNRDWFLTWLGIRDPSLNIEHLTERINLIEQVLDAEIRAYTKSRILGELKRHGTRSFRYMEISGLIGLKEFGGVISDALSELEIEKKVSVSKNGWIKANA
jgi:hypothetical protein